MIEISRKINIRLYYMVKRIRIITGFSFCLYLV